MFVLFVFIQNFGFILSSVTNQCLALSSWDFGLFCLHFSWQFVLILSHYTLKIGWRECNTNFSSISNLFLYSQASQSCARLYRVQNLVRFYLIFSWKFVISSFAWHISDGLKRINHEFQFVSLLDLHTNTHTFIKNERRWRNLKFFKPQYVTIFLSLHFIFNFCSFLFFPFISYRSIHFLISHYFTVHSSISFKFTHTMMKTRTNMFCFE
jgi:hypothetical protein